jgi:hypothetical protein
MILEILMETHVRYNFRISERDPNSMEYWFLIIGDSRDINDIYPVLLRLSLDQFLILKRVITELTKEQDLDINCLILIPEKDQTLVGLPRFLREL